MATYGGRHRRAEDSIHFWQVHAHQYSHYNRAEDDRSHEQWLPIQSLWSLDDAVIVKGQVQIHCHHERDERKGEDQLEAVTHYESPKEQHTG